MADRALSPIDQLYEEIMGDVPIKAGTAYERLATAAYALVHGVDAKFNQYLTGLSGSRYQLDGLVSTDTMVEAKDYTIRGDKVGREDLQKQEGAMVDIPSITKGVFASATDYTCESDKYAQGSGSSPMMKEIVTYDIRPSTEDDKKGRLSKIEVRFEAAWPDINPKNVRPVYVKGEVERLNNDLLSKGYKEGDPIEIRSMELYDAAGKVLTTIMEFTHDHQPHFSDTDDKVTEMIPFPSFLMIEGDLYGIEGLKYCDVPIERIRDVFIIEARGDAKLLVKSEKDGINKLVTDVELRDTINAIIR